MSITYKNCVFRKVFWTRTKRTVKNTCSYSDSHHETLPKFRLNPKVTKTLIFITEVCCSKLGYCCSYCEAEEFWRLLKNFHYIIVDEIILILTSKVFHIYSFKALHIYFLSTNFAQKTTYNTNYRLLILISNDYLKRTIW